MGVIRDSQVQRLSTVVVFWAMYTLRTFVLRATKIIIPLEGQGGFET